MFRCVERDSYCSLDVRYAASCQRVENAVRNLLGVSVCVYALYWRISFLRATAGTAIARLSHRNSVCLSVCPSVCHTSGSGKNGAS